MDPTFGGFGLVNMLFQGAARAFRVTGDVSKMQLEVDSRLPAAVGYGVWFFHILRFITHQIRKYATPVVCFDCGSKGVHIVN